MSSPISSGARASAKGMPVRMANNIEANIKAFRSRSGLAVTKSRGRNYRAVKEALLRMYSGAIIKSWEEGKGKDQVFSVVVIMPDGRDFGLAAYAVRYRDPMAWEDYDLNVNITRHALERLYQRFAGYDDNAALSELGGVFEFGTMLTITSKAEIGTGNGVAVIGANVTKEKKRSLTVITWIDAGKLRPEQDATMGAMRML